MFTVALSSITGMAINIAIRSYYRNIRQEATIEWKALNHLYDKNDREIKQALKIQIEPVIIPFTFQYGQISLILKAIAGISACGPRARLQMP